jgi:hypothetical protein
MRLRFAVSGHAPAVEIKEPTPETNSAASETGGREETTNRRTKIEAAAGN